MPTETLVLPTQDEIEQEFGVEEGAGIHAALFVTATPDVAEDALCGF